MGDLSKIIKQLKLPTNTISTEILQEVLKVIKKSNVFQEDKEVWDNIAKYIWYHLESGLDKYDDQLLCATCFYTLIAQLDSNVDYLKLIEDKVQKEITSRKEDIKNVNNTSHTISLVYGIFQSSFMNKMNESYFENNHIHKLLQASFDLLVEMAFDYSRFTFIVFKCLSLLSKLNGTKFFVTIFTQRNQLKLLHIINNNWENPITGVRDLNKEIFHTCLMAVDKDTFEIILTNVNNFYWNKAKYLMLAEIMNHPLFNVEGVEIINKEHVEGLLYSLHKPGLVSAGADMYFAVLKKIKSQDEWSEIFLESIINIFQLGDNSKAKENLINYWILATLKCFPMLGKLLVEELSETNYSDIKTYSCLSIIKQANKLGILNKYGELKDRKSIQETITNGLVHSSHQIRMLAFEIICVNQNKDLPSEDQYQLVLNFLQENVNSDCTVLRINMLSSFSSFLTHIHMVWCSNAMKNDKTNKLAEFSYKFQDFIINSLLIEGNYQRKITCLKLANLFFSKFNEVPRKKQKQRNVSDKTLMEVLKNNKNRWLIDEEIIKKKLLQLLKDPADDVRDITGKLLLDNYAEYLLQTHILNSLIEEALNCMKSKFFFEISCGQSMLRLIISLLAQGHQPQGLFKNVEHIFEFTCNELITEYKQNRDIVESILLGKQLHSYLTMLHGLLDVCHEKTYLMAMNDDIISELLIVLEGVSNQFNWEEETSSSDFSKISDMVQIMIKNSGFYSYNKNDDAKISGMEKIVLMCLWLNVKGACEMAAMLIKYQKEDSHINVCQRALDIISHVLETCRHKGAIEAAGLAIGKSIQHLTSLPENMSLSKLPHLFLQSKLKVLISEANRMASVSRRGAGLSIMVHRIVSSDVKRGKPLFHYFMKIILETCNKTKDVPTSITGDVDIDNEKDLPKAIYIHFLTRIVTDSSLASEVMFYSVELSELAFGNLTNHHWQIRNAALQLYGALIQKLIGQKKPAGTTDEITVTVACDELRTHFPMLWNYILDHLGNSVCEDQLQHHSNLVPILNILASLAPRYIFTFHATDQEAMDKKLLANLRLLLNSPIYTVRRLTAHAIANIYSLEDNYNDLTQNVFSENGLHGNLLLVAKYKNMHCSNEDKKDALIYVIKKHFLKMFSEKPHSYLCKQIFVDVFDEEMETIDLNKIFTELKTNSYEPGVSLWASKCLQKHLGKISCEMIPHILQIVVTSNDFETYGQYLLETIETTDKISDATVTEIVTSLLKVKTKFESSVLWKILYQCALKVDLKCLIMQELAIDVYEYLKHNKMRYKLRYMLPFAARIVHSEDKQKVLMIIKIVESLTKPESEDVEMRYIAATVNKELAVNFKSLPENAKIIVLKSTLVLLQDEDEDVRLLSARFYSKILNTNQSFHPYICLNNILKYSFLTSILTEIGIQQLLEELKEFLRDMSNSKATDEFNPFASDSNNIYMEVNIYKHLIDKLNH